MKKLLSIITAVILLVSVCTFAAFATDSGLNSYEEALIDDLSQEVTNAAGLKLHIPTEYVNQAKNYFISSVDMTEPEYNDIVAILNEGIAIVEAGNYADLRKLPLQDKQDLLDVGERMVAVIGMTFVYNQAESVVEIYDPTGALAFTDEPVLKTTGAEYSYTPAIVIAVVLLGFAAAGAVYVLKRSRVAA